MTDPEILKQIQTVVILMLENRSFDHMLGHLSNGNAASMPDVEGLKDLSSDQYVNTFETVEYSPFWLRDGELPADLPHERDPVQVQLGLGPDGRHNMDGFVRAYFDANPGLRTQYPEAMGMLPASQAPITDFLARHFTVCDHWFSAIPTSTHPNRMMALTGTSLVDRTYTHVIPVDNDHTFLLNWLNANDVSWRVYHASVASFFMLLARPEILTDQFRSVDRLADDLRNDAVFPHVVLIEPCYFDAPFLGMHANDNHAPMPVAPGEGYLRRIYETLTTASPDRWKDLLFIVTCDEHGGFFDHVEPRQVRFTPRQSATFTDGFGTTGPRVPGLLISPYVAKGFACKTVFDHTSILQFLAQRFTSGTPYSDEVDARGKQGIGSISDALVGSSDTPAPIAPPPPPYSRELAGPIDQPPPSLRLEPEMPSNSQEAFRNSALHFLDTNPSAVDKYPELAAWRQRGAPVGGRIAEARPDDG